MKQCKFLEPLQNKKIRENELYKIRQMNTLIRLQCVLYILFQDINNRLR